MPAVILAFSAGLIAASSCYARDIAPPTPPAPVILGQVIDRQQPAVIPKFLAQRAVPAGLADRGWAIQNTYPAFGCYGWGFFYGGWGYSFGCGGYMGSHTIYSSDSTP